MSWNKTSRVQKEQFDWPMPLNIATQVAGKVLHCATWEKFFATLRDALRKVELISTFRNDCGNRKIATNLCSRVCYNRQYCCNLCRNIVATCVATKLRDKLQEKLPSLTAPLLFCWILQFLWAHGNCNCVREWSLRDVQTDWKQIKSWIIGELYFPKSKSKNALTSACVGICYEFCRLKLRTSNSGWNGSAAGTQYIYTRE